VKYVAAQYFYEPIWGPKTTLAIKSPSPDQPTSDQSDMLCRNIFQAQKALNCNDAKVNGIAAA
jgi:hypothetical protein